MIIKSSDNQWLKAGDLTTLKEVLHPINVSLNLSFSLAHAFLDKNETSLLHVLNETEIYFIINGIGEISLDGVISYVGKGDVIVVNPGTVQSLKNKGKEKLEFLCIVSPPWTKEGEQIFN